MFGQQTLGAASLVPCPGDPAVFTVDACLEVLRLPLCLGRWEMCHEQGDSVTEIHNRSKKEDRAEPGWRGLHPFQHEIPLRLLPPRLLEIRLVGCEEPHFHVGTDGAKLSLTESDNSKTEI